LEIRDVVKWEGKINTIKINSGVNMPDSNFSRKVIYLYLYTILYA